MIQNYGEFEKNGFWSWIVNLVDSEVWVWVYRRRERRDRSAMLARSIRDGAVCGEVLVPVIRTGGPLVVGVPVASGVLVDGGATLELVVDGSVATGVVVDDAVVEDAAEDSVEDSDSVDSLEETAEDDEACDEVEVVFKNGPSVGIGTGSVFVLTGAWVVTAGGVGIETTAIWVGATGNTVWVLTEVDGRTADWAAASLQKLMNGSNWGTT
jgi:hypothetical protein